MKPTYTTQNYFSSYARLLLALAWLLALPSLARAQIVNNFFPTTGAVGSTVYLNGTGLANTTSVRFGELPAKFIILSLGNNNYQLAVTVPVLASTHKLTVTATGVTSVTSQTFTVTRASTSYNYTQVADLQSGNSAINVGNYSAPAVIDLDGNSLLDLLLSDSRGHVLRYEQAQAGAITFNPKPDLTSNGNAISADFSSVAITDLDGNGRLDLLVGNRVGNVVRYEQVTIGAATFTAGVNLTSNGSDIVARGLSAPTVTDLDDNGRLDLLVGNVTGDVLRYEQVTAGASTFTAGTVLMASGSPVFVGSYSALAVSDLDGDGLLDLVVGSQQSPLVFDEQIAPSSTSFVRLTAVPTNLANIGFTKPFVTDLDGDGQLDLLIGNFGGTVAHYVQADPPILTNVNFPNGPVGTLVTLTGQNLTGATAVSFNGTAATTFAVVNATTVTATVPTGATTGPVTVTTPGGVSNGVTFTVTPPATAAPVVVSPANNSTTDNSPIIQFTAPPNSLLTVYLNGQQGGTYVVSPSGNLAFRYSALAQATYTLYATAQSSGSAMSGPSNVVTFTVDATAPTAVSSNRQTPTAATTNATSLTFRVTFSELVTGVDAPDFTLTTTAGTVTSSSRTTTAISGSVYDVTVSGVSGNGTVRLDLNASGTGIADAVGNPLSGGYTGGQAYTLDQMAPTVVLSTTATSPTSTSPIPFSATFSETVTGLSASSISVTNGTVASGPTGSGSGPYTFSVTPTGNGAVTVTIAANAAQDAAGNGNTASNSLNVTYSAPVTLTTWTAGAGTQDWFTAGNWSAGVPTASTDALLPAGVRFYPLVTAAGATTRALTINSPGSVTLAILGTLTVNGTLTNGGLITQSAGALTVNGNVSMSGTINKSAGTVSVTGSLTNTGNLNQSGGSFAVGGSLSNNSGGTVSHTGGTLSVSGDLTTNSTFTTTNPAGTGGGTVLLGSTSAGTSSNIFGSQTIRFWNLTVNTSGAQLSTSAGASVRSVLTLNGTFATNGNTFTLESASTGTALVVNNGSSVVTGNATVQRYIDPSLNAGPGYRHYSAPVSTSTVADLATPTGFTPVVNPTYNTAATPTAVQPFPTVYGYDEQRVNLTNSMSAFDRGYVSPTALSDPLTVGRGYTVNIGASQLVDFVGSLNNGTLPLPLTSTRDTNPAGGWQLLGNPYPAPLNYSLVSDVDRMGLDGAIYVFSSTSQYGGQYRSYINGFGNPVLPVGQGFFARVSTGRTSASMTFRNSQRLTTPDGTTFQRTAETRPVVQLTLQGTGSPLADELYVYFEQGATDSFDRAFDAEKLPNPSGLNLSSSLSASQRLSTDGRAPLGTAQLVVPLAVGVPAAGTYSLAAAQLLNLTNVPVYLRDKQTGALIDLAQQPSYQFAVSNAATLLTGRFELVFSPQQALATVPAALAEQVSVYPNPAREQVVVELPVALNRQPVTVALVDALGRVVRTRELPIGLVTHTLPLTGISTGVYALRLTTEAGIMVKKLVVK